MDGTPAGWYDDPDDPAQWRYWDGTSWTEQRAPKGEAQPSPSPAPAPPASPAPAPTPPPGPMPPPAPSAGSVPPGGPAAPPPPIGSEPPGGSWAPPPGAAPTKPSRRGLWIGLVIVALVVLIGIGVIIALVLSGGSDNTASLEKKLPQEMESDFSAKGLDVNVTKADCDEVPSSNGPFTTTCRLTIDGLQGTAEVTVDGNVGDDKVTFNASTTNNLADEKLAIQAAQQLVDQRASGVTVTRCDLPSQIVEVVDGLTFTCEANSDQTVTFEVTGGQLEITAVS